MKRWVLTTISPFVALKVFCLRHLIAFYTQPKTIAEIVDQTIGRVLDLFDLDAGTFPRWGETIALTTASKRKPAIETSE
jgi:3-polyprenyl-4-hydroxybenzoate decarboxylase